MARIPRRLWQIVLLTVTVGGAALALFVYLRPPPPPTVPNSAPLLAPLRRDGFPALSMDVPPVERPEFVSAAEASIADDDMVIGIVVDGEARAYLREALEYPLENHVVTDTIQSRKIAVTHCDYQRCTRVLTTRQPDQPLDIRIGGWRDDQSMELIVGGKRYSQKSAEIPLAEIPCSETTWGQWRKEHPQTTVYMGGTR